MGKEIDIAFALLRGALDGTVPEVEHMAAVQATAETSSVPP